MTRESRSQVVTASYRGLSGKLHRAGLRRSRQPSEFKTVRSDAKPPRRLDKQRAQQRTRSIIPNESISRISCELPIAIECASTIEPLYCRRIGQIQNTLYISVQFGDTLFMCFANGSMY